MNTRLIHIILVAAALLATVAAVTAATSSAHNDLTPQRQKARYYYLEGLSLIHI